MAICFKSSNTRVYIHQIALRIFLCENIEFREFNETGEDLVITPLH